jgi:hypothetical protein
MYLEFRPVFEFCFHVSACGKTYSIQVSNWLIVFTTFCLLILVIILKETQFDYENAVLCYRFTGLIGNG